jgi:hypothetical protein
MSRSRLVLVALALALCPFGSSGPSSAGDEELDGDASSGLVTAPPHGGVQAVFTERSYAPRAVATLALRGRAPLLRLAFFRAGAGHEGPLQGAAVGGSVWLRSPENRAALRVGDWPSGLYYARITTPGVGSWYAPFVVRPRRLGTQPVLVVLPTNTWQAYNFEDGQSWYANPVVHRVSLERPYLDGGVPPHYHGYDRGFLRWLALHDEHPDFLADDDLEHLRATTLARYDLVIFPGHEEYVTAREYDLVERYRDLGGNLAFLSANDFFYRVTRHGATIERDGRWRDLGRPEAALVGAQYVDWNHARYANRPYVVTGVAQTPWLFRGTGLHDGDRFGIYGIEVDARAGASPAGTRVLARIPEIFGAGKSAEMTYYTTPAGAKVFSAGVMNFGGSALWPVVSTMMGNLWAELAQP